MIIIIIYVLSMSEKLFVPEQTHRDIIPSQDMHKAIYIYRDRGRDGHKHQDIHIQLEIKN